VTKPRSFRVEESAPLFAWMLAHVPGMNNTRAKALLKHRAILINGAPATRHDTPLRPGDEVSIQGAPGGDSSSRAKASLPFAILHEDAHIVAIDKPAGLLTISTDGEKDRTAHRLLGEREPSGRVFVVHRLDRETSGVLLFAKSEEVKIELQARWDAAEKTYQAVVEGVPKEREGSLQHFLYEDPKSLAVLVAAGPDHGKLATLHYTVLYVRGTRALLAIRLESGRKHQIRVQLAAMGHPVLGDDRYGRRGSAPRLALHACRLAFPHPVTGEPRVIESDLPAEIAALVGR